MYRFINFNIKLKEETIEELSLSEFEWFWGVIDSCQVLSELFIEKYQNKLDLFWIPAHQAISEQFIEKCSDKINWNLISLYQNLSLEFLIKHKNKINLDIIKYNQKIPRETKDKFIKITNKNK